MPYAANTTVPVERSRSEIEQLLRRYGADALMYGEDPQRWTLGFRLQKRQVRLELARPCEGDDRVAKRESGRPRPRGEIAMAIAQEERRRWRALVLVVKAKLSACEEGISTLEREFLADMLVANGRTVMQVLAPHIDAARDHELLQLPAFAVAARPPRSEHNVEIERP